MTRPPDISKSLVASVIVPALNEESTIREVVQKLLNLSVTLEIIVVNDGSSDLTPSILESFKDQILVITNEFPQGKGSAIRKAIAIATGDIIAIQDADLEYKPEELIKVIEPIQNNEADFVLGTRFSHGFPKSMALPNKTVNLLLAWSVRLLYGSRITDEATCYKAVRTSAIKRMNLQCNRFEFCPEVVSKSIRMKLRIKEVPISYVARSKAAGKKIRWTDAPEAFLTLLKYRFWKPT